MTVLQNREWWHALRPFRHIHRIGEILESPQEFDVKAATSTLNTSLLNMLLLCGTTEQRTTVCIEAISHIHRIGELLESTDVDTAARLLNKLLVYGSEEVQVSVLTFLIDTMENRWINVLCVYPKEAAVRKLLVKILSFPIGDFSSQMINRMITKMETLSKPGGDEDRAKIIRDIIYELKDQLPECVVLQNAIRRYERRQTALTFEKAATQDHASPYSLPKDVIRHTIGKFL